MRCTPAVWRERVGASAAITTRLPVRCHSTSAASAMCTCSVACAHAGAQAPWNRSPGTTATTIVCAAALLFVPYRPRCCPHNCGARTMACLCSTRQLRALHRPIIVCAYLSHCCPYNCRARTMTCLCRTRLPRAPHCTAPPHIRTCTKAAAGRIPLCSAGARGEGGEGDGGGEGHAPWCASSRR